MHFGHVGNKKIPRNADPNQINLVWKKPACCLLAVISYDIRKMVVILHVVFPPEQQENKEGSDYQK